MRALAAAIVAIAIAVPAISTAGGQGNDDRVKVATKLKGKTVEPGPGDPDGEGRVALFLRADKRRVCFELDVDALNLVRAARIHQGSDGDEGPAKLTLLSDQAGLDGNGSYDGCEKKVRRGLLRSISRGPGDFYVSVQTEGYPDGAIRGQLKPRG